MNGQGGDLSSRIESVRERIAEACVRSGRDPGVVKLLAVTKTVEPARIQEAYRLGLKCFGENRVQELISKMDALPPDAEWHMIGQLQANKVKQVVGKVALIQSLDRNELAGEIESQAGKRGVRKVPCLVEVNASGEVNKAGFSPDNVERFLEQLDEDSPLAVCGLMAIGPFVEDTGKIRDVFKNVKDLYEKMKEKFPHFNWRELSMGMSHDFEIALEEGSTMVRIGSLLFGPRVVK